MTVSQLHLGRFLAIDPAAKAIADMQASDEASARQRQARSEASDALVKEAMQKAQANAQALREADEAPRRKACDDSRERRVSHAKEMVIARMDAESKLYENAKAIRAACKLTERRTGAVNVQSSGNGYRVSPELADDVQCSRLPKGITKSDAWVVLARDREGTKGPTGPILDGEDASPEDGMCFMFDNAVGLNFRSVTFDDLSSVERLRNWKAPAAAATSN